MAKKLYEESNIQAIANAIRAKNGKTTKYKTSEMAAAINAISTGSGGSVAGVPNKINVTGDCEKKFAYNTWNWVIENFGDRVVTSDLTDGNRMFYYSTELTAAPLTLNFKEGSIIDLTECFSNAAALTSLPTFNNCNAYDDSKMFNNCRNLREIPSDFINGFNLSQLIGSRSCLFNNCYSLRSFPMEYLNHASSSATYNNSIYYYGFNNCYFLDEIVGLPVPYTVSTWTNNAFVKTFDNCSRLKNLIFATNEDGTPIVVKWKNQIIDLTVYCGYFDMNYNQFLPNYYNSGCSDEDRVISEFPVPTNPNWWTGEPGISRYSVASATATINSLPDASAYLATAGGTNTIKFPSTLKFQYDLTEETIAIAAAKGWTVSLGAVYA